MNQKILSNICYYCKNIYKCHYCVKYKENGPFLYIEQQYYLKKKNKKNSIKNESKKSYKT